MNALERIVDDEKANREWPTLFLPLFIVIKQSGANNQPEGLN